MIRKKVTPFTISYIYVGECSASSVEHLMPVSQISCKLFFFGENQAMNNL